VKSAIVLPACSAFECVLLASCIIVLPLIVPMPAVDRETHVSSLIAVPPDILDYPTSTDMVVREGTNVTLRCAATGSPQPSIIWRREGGETIPLGNGQEGMSTRVFRVCEALPGSPRRWTRRMGLLLVLSSKHCVAVTIAISHDWS
jgi:hypothetical protein